MNERNWAHGSLWATLEQGIIQLWDMFMESWSFVRAVFSGDFVLPVRSRLAFIRSVQKLRLTGLSIAPHWILPKLRHSVSLCYDTLFHQKSEERKHKCTAHSSRLIGPVADIAHLGTRKIVWSTALREAWLAPLASSAGSAQTWGGKEYSILLAVSMGCNVFPMLHFVERKRLLSLADLTVVAQTFLWKS